MNTFLFESEQPKTKFGFKFKIPIYDAKDGSKEFIQQLTDYILYLENNIIAKEALVSEVPKNNGDPYKHTQQWKQHNLLKDEVGLGGEHLERFPYNPVIDELFKMVRSHYLVHLANLKYPRIKAYIHAWANVLSPKEWISRHSHITSEESYLASTYYLTTNDTYLYLANPIDGTQNIKIETIAGKLIFFPSWMSHWSDVCEDNKNRISIAFDIVTEETVKKNPWRPHVLLDDPKIMLGLEG
jgi:hypothetical protein